MQSHQSDQGLSRGLFPVGRGRKTFTGKRVEPRTAGWEMEHEIDGWSGVGRNAGVVLDCRGDEGGQPQCKDFVLPCRSLSSAPSVILWESLTCRNSLVKNPFYFGLKGANWDCPGEGCGPITGRSAMRGTFHNLFKTKIMQVCTTYWTCATQSVKCWNAPSRRTCSHYLFLKISCGI